MVDGYVIDGKKMPDDALYPWLVGSLARALLYYSQSQENDDRRALAAIAAYYSLFHLGMFLIFACPKHQTEDLRAKIQSGIGSGNDPSPNVQHKALLNFLRTCGKQGLSKNFVRAVEAAERLRVFINYGPRVHFKGHGDIHVNTCDHRASELIHLQNQLPELFHEAVIWARKQGPNDGIWIPLAIQQVREFFNGSARLYADWCTTEEANTVELLRMSLETESLRDGS